MLFFYLKKFNISASEHIGFWDNKSIETACHTFIENIQQALDTKFACSRNIS
jgi:lactate dehydrogenase-like 2-hydroxyacid dehydrogenase